MKKIIWKMQEPGWYACELGELRKSKFGRWWIFNPANILDAPIGPFKTLKEAKAEAERRLT